jgi:hypothetical protein
MSDLSVAKMLAKNSERSKGRTLEAQFKDLRRAVERIIAHLERAEKANKAK